MISKKEINGRLKALVNQDKVIKDSYKRLRDQKEYMDKLRKEQSEMEKDIIEFILNTDTESVILVDGTSYTFRLHKPYATSAKDYDLIWEEANRY